MITLVSNHGRRARIAKGYTLKDGIAEVPRDRLRALGKSFALNEYWAKAESSDGTTRLVKGVGAATSTNGGFEW